MPSAPLIRARTVTAHSWLQICDLCGRTASSPTLRLSARMGSALSPVHLSVPMFATGDVIHAMDRVWPLCPLLHHKSMLLPLLTGYSIHSLNGCPDADGRTDKVNMTHGQVKGPTSTQVLGQTAALAAQVQQVIRVRNRDATSSPRDPISTSR
jgi:hypothetical protein